MPALAPGRQELLRRGIVRRHRGHHQVRLAHAEDDDGVAGGAPGQVARLDQGVVVPGREGVGLLHEGDVAFAPPALGHLGRTAAGDDGCGGRGVGSTLPDNGCGGRRHFHGGDGKR